MGSKSSSVGNSGCKSPSLLHRSQAPPHCSCNITMKMLVSNTIDNPKRKFWKCRNVLNGCGMFIWDDELGEFNNVEVIQCKCTEMTKDALKEILKDIATDNLGADTSNEKILRLKKKVAMEKKKNHNMMVALVMSWMFFAAFYMFL
ncbi:uncharacterized protein LOC131628163 [Vicia villosa]|uniref:uncharacterized protein LOC131628163 n=1 Tax=Vicia villosa TaxID=3911 RepID=UPI00273CADAA|nr:uncharacterized protein LOC131628163 [Vicia villosa]